MFKKNFSKEPTEKQVIGKIGEDKACLYLEGLGFIIVERNYLKKWGEIDIIAKKATKLHFIEVKSVSREIISNLNNNVIHETPVVEQSSLRSRYHDSYRPEDNIHFHKLQRLGRAIQSYLLDRDIPDNIDWQFDVVTVYLDQKRGLHKVSILEDVVL